MAGYLQQLLVALDKTDEPGAFDPRLVLERVQTASAGSPTDYRLHQTI